MRTKTMILSALLGALGSVSVMAQTNVYSLNAVGYINVTCYPGFNIISCPLIASPDNTVNTLMNNGNGSLTGSVVEFYNPATLFSIDQAEAVGGRNGTPNTNGWAANGTNVLAPGTACWFENNSAVVAPYVASNIVLTFVGTVPTGPVTNVLVPKSFNLVSSIVPASGDIITNSIMNLTNYNLFDVVESYNPSNNPTFTIYQSGSGRGYGGYGYDSNWASSGDPIQPTVGGGFWYQNNSTTPVNWVENYSVSQ